MAGYEDGETPASQHVAAAGDGGAAERHVHVHLYLELPRGIDEADRARPGISGVAGLQLGLGNIQVNNYYGDRTRVDDGGPTPMPASGPVDSPHRDKPGSGRAVTAQWALWGMDSDGSGYRVLRCSNGTFGPGDFAEIITRYASGTMDPLPQYTICWVPGYKGREGYLAVGIHELADADPGRSGGRVRAAGGREIQYVRLFCVDYKEMVAHRVSYRELVEAVRGHQLPDGDSNPIPVEVSAIKFPAPDRPARGLAADVAALLLTGAPVCVVGAGRLTAEDRLLFIDQVMSLLPYGLRATLSASTWADTTAPNLKLRLYFAAALRGDSGRTRYVRWGQHEDLDLSWQDQLLPSYYRNWLRHAGPEAEVALADMTARMRFGPEEIHTMISGLLERRPVKDLLGEIAYALRRDDQPGVHMAVARLKGELDGAEAPGDQQGYRQAIKRLGLLHDHPRLGLDSEMSLYRVLLRLAFDVPLSYASYCEIEDCADGPLPDTLRRVILQLGFSEILPFVLTASLEATVTGEELMAALDRQGIPATAPLTEFQQHAASALPRHRSAGYDLAVRYLLEFAEDPRRELARRRYLADTLEAAFPGSQRDQQTRLEDTLRFIYGEPLSQDQVSELYKRQGAQATPAFRAAIDSLAPSPVPEDQPSMPEDRPSMPEDQPARWTAPLRTLISKAVAFVVARSQP